MPVTNKTPLFVRKQPGGMFTVTDQSVTTGNIYFVDDSGTDASGYGQNPDSPVATIDYAIGLCTANQGDIIYVMPGHAESVTAAGGITCDIAGIKIVGLGHGADRPKVTFTTSTAADVEIDAASVWIENIVFVCDIDAAVAPIDVDAADCTIKNCVFRDLGTDNAIRWILADANADRLHVCGCVNEGTATAGNTAWITLTGCDHVIIEDCISEGDFSAANIQVLTTAITDAVITRNHLENANAVDVNIEGLASSTGFISFNACQIATNAQTTWINTAGNMVLAENYGINNAAETGVIIGTASS